MRALLLVDIQNDFCPGGTVPVTGGDTMIPLINKLQKKFDHIVATQDWHPPDHLSFASCHGKKARDVVCLEGVEQILWPDHCITGSQGAEFVKELDTGRIAKIFHKGTEKEIDSYSTFFDNAHRRATGLEDYLKKKNVEEIYIAGLATDYCVKYSALDALKLGFKTFVIGDACRGIDLKPGDVRQAIEEMKKAGVKIVQSNELLGSR